MDDCCKVTALLEYFEWTISKSIDSIYLRTQDVEVYTIYGKSNSKKKLYKQHSRSKGQGCGFSVPLFIHASGWGRLLMLISSFG